MSRYLLRLWAAVLILGPAFAAQPIVPARTHAELTARLEKILKENKVPGLSLALAEKDGSLWTVGLGKADVAAGTPATADTLFRVGSISKLFAGLSALKLVEEGRLSLDAPVHTLVPEVRFTNRWEQTDPVRVVHLLEHTTGWDNLHFKEYAHSDPRPATLAEGLAVGPESRTCAWRPGTRFSYCNSGPAVLAAIVEKITGLRYEDYVRATFFQPMGMASADYFQSPRVTTLYQQDGRTPYPYLHILVRPAGALNASARDMGACLRFFLRRGQVDGARLLSEASIQRMETPTSDLAARSGFTYGYGLCNRTTADAHGFVWHGHGGAVRGAVAHFAYLPTAGVGYFGALNTANESAGKAVGDQVEAYLTRDLPAPVPPPAQAVPASVAKAFTGWYAIANPQPEAFAPLVRLVLMGHVTFGKTGLRLKPAVGPALSFTAVDGTHFRLEGRSIAQLVLLDTPGGPILVSSPVELEKITAAGAWLKLTLAGLFLLALVSVPLFALVWGTRWVFGRMRGVPNLRVRVLPLLAWLAMAAMIFALVGHPGAFQDQFGKRTFWSVLFMAMTWAFPLLSAASLWAALLDPRKGNRGAHVHSLVVAAVFVLVSLFMAWSGFIGFRTWA